MTGRLPQKELVEAAAQRAEAMSRDQEALEQLQAERDRGANLEVSAPLRLWSRQALLALLTPTA